MNCDGLYIIKKGLMCENANDLMIDLPFSFWQFFSQLPVVVCSWLSLLLNSLLYIPKKDSMDNCFYHASSLCVRLQMLDCVCAVFLSVHFSKMRQSHNGNRDGWVV